MAGDKKQVDTSWRCMWGIFLLALCVFVALGLFSYDWKDISRLRVPPNIPPNNLIGPVGAWISYGLFTFMGIGAYLFPFWALAMGLILTINKDEKIMPKFGWSVVLLFALSAIVDLYSDAWPEACTNLNITSPGGVFGTLITRGLLVRWSGTVGTSIVVWMLVAVSFIMMVQIRTIVRVASVTWAFCVNTFNSYMERRGENQDRRNVLNKQEHLIEKRRRKLEKALLKQQQAQDSAKETPVAEEDAEQVKPKSKKSLLGRKKKLVPKPAPEEPSEPTETSFGQYQLPSIDFLHKPKAGEDVLSADMKTTAKVLMETLAEFGIEAEVTNFEKGPVVTRFELLPAPGVRVERISGLSNNIALALKATSIRVQAPIPGKGVVGIEVPNNVAKIVYLREVLESEPWTSGKAKIPLVLGKDVGGNDIVADLAAMPHLLVAGATGAGKTVCVNSILTGLLMAKNPDELRLMLVDPKIVEFTVFNHLPHLVVPVITDPKKVALGLRWAIAEMEKRYKLFAKVGVRNIASYNERVIPKQEELFPSENEEEVTQKKADDPPEKVPYIVIVIDELADLMLADGAEIENCVARLAQLSRAVGIHMILSTQRPSVNVITGTIKANFPARIAFQVAQKVDSRTILDQSGAEKLLGKGDMLYLPPGSSKLIRAQGSWTTDAEITEITNFIKAQGAPNYVTEVKAKIERKVSKLEEGEDDELLEQAIEIIRETNRASTSSLQRRLRIGYTRAARIIDILEERGIVGPPRGSEPREILIDLDGDIPNNPEENLE